MLKAMGIEDEKIDQIIEEHAESVDALKAQRDELKEAAGKADGTLDGSVKFHFKGAPADGAQASNVLEQPRGECYYYARGNGSKNLERMRMRTPTSQNLAGMTVALKGCDLADVNMIILTIDPCISCTER